MSSGLTVTYNSYTIGGSTGPPTIGKYRLRDNYVDGEFSCEFVVSGSTDAAFATACRAAEAALRTPRQTLTVTQGGESLVNFDTSTNGRTAYEVATTCEKVAGIEDSGRARRYRFTFRCKRVADLSGQSGRRDERVEATYSLTSRAVVVLSGVYTAQAGSPGTTASAQYLAQIDSHASTILSGISGSITWILGPHTWTKNDENTEVSYRREYWECPSGLRESEWECEYDAAKIATVTIRGVYVRTAVGVSAKDNYTANEDTHTNTVLSAFSLSTTTAERVLERASPNDQNDQCRFVRVYRQIIHQQSPGSTNDADVYKDEIVIRYAKLSPDSSPLPQTSSAATGGGATGGPRAQDKSLGAGGLFSTGQTNTTARRPVEISATYSAWLDQTRTTDLEGKWTGTLRNHVIQYIAARLRVSVSAILRDEVSTDIPNNKLTARLECLGTQGDVFSIRVSTGVEEESGERLASVRNGKPHNYLPYNVGPKKFMSRKVQVSYLATGSFKPENLFLGSMDSWRFLGRSQPVSSDTSRGTVSAYLERTTEWTERWQYYEALVERPVPPTATGRGNA